MVSFILADTLLAQSGPPPSTAGHCPVPPLAQPLYLFSPPARGASSASTRAFHSLPRLCGRIGRASSHLVAPYIPPKEIGSIPGLSRLSCFLLEACFFYRFSKKMLFLRVFYKKKKFFFFAKNDLWVTWEVWFSFRVVTMCFDAIRAD